MPPKKHIEEASPKLGFAPQNQDCYEGERLDRLLQSLERKIESARLTGGKSLPEKFWFKQQFAIGVNDVTRVLERMPPMSASLAAKRKAPCVELQIVLIASDCNPRWLSKHLASLAMSRKIPVLFFKDNKAASLRLGQLVKLKTAIAIGVKAKGNVINQFLEEILGGDVIHLFFFGYKEACAQTKKEKQLKPQQPAPGFSPDNLLEQLDPSFNLMPQLDSNAYYSTNASSKMKPILSSLDVGMKIVPDHCSEGTVVFKTDNVVTFLQIFS